MAQKNTGEKRRGFFERIWNLLTNSPNCLENRVSSENEQQDDSITKIRPKCLTQVKVGTLMHTGGLYSYLTGTNTTGFRDFKCDSGLNNGYPHEESRNICFGVAEAFVPETNAATGYSMLGSNASIDYSIIGQSHHAHYHLRMPHECTIIYKSDYYTRIPFITVGYPGSESKDLYYLRRKIEKGLISGCGGGVTAQPEFAFNLSEIDAIIAYSQEDVLIYKDLFQRNGILAPIYLAVKGDKVKSQNPYEEPNWKRYTFILQE
jgi:hypothetical protein